MLEVRSYSSQDFTELASWICDEREFRIWAGPQMAYPLTPLSLHNPGQVARTGLRNAQWVAVSSQMPIGYFELLTDSATGTVRLMRVIVAPKRRGSGVGSEMIERSIGLAFENPEITRLELNVYAQNSQAIKCYERIGFVHEGVRRESAKFRDEMWDTVIMSVLRREL